MAIRSTLPALPPARVRTIVAGLPPARGYVVEVKPLRYRTTPHLAGLCDYETRVITLQVPEPFRPFRQRIPYRARRLKAHGARRDPFRFRWFYRDVLYRTKSDVIRFLYCHEYYHYFLFEHLGRKGSAETACDRFALEHFRRRGKVYLRDAQSHLRPARGHGHAAAETGTSKLRFGGSHVQARADRPSTPQAV